MRRGNDHRECLRGILSPSNEGTDLLFKPLVRWTIYVPSYGRQLEVGESGNAEWTYVPYLICQVEPDFTTMINESISDPHNMDYT